MSKVGSESPYGKLPSPPSPSLQVDGASLEEVQVLQEVGMDEHGVEVENSFTAAEGSRSLPVPTQDETSSSSSTSLAHLLVHGFEESVTSIGASLRERLGAEVDQAMHQLNADVTDVLAEGFAVELGSYGELSGTITTDLFPSDDPFVADDPIRKSTTDLLLADEDDVVWSQSNARLKIGGSFEQTFPLATVVSGQVGFEANGELSISLTYPHGVETDAQPTLIDIGLDSQIPLRASDARSLLPGSEVHLSGKGTIGGSLGVSAGVGPQGEILVGASAGVHVGQTWSGNLEVKVKRLEGEQVQVTIAKGRESVRDLGVQLKAGLDLPGIFGQENLDTAQEVLGQAKVILGQAADVDLGELLKEQSGFNQLVDEASQQLEGLNLGNLLSEKLGYEELKGDLSDNLKKLNFGDLLGERLDQLTPEVQRYLQQLNLGDVLNEQLSNRIEQSLEQGLEPLQTALEQLGEQGLSAIEEREQLLEAIGLLGTAKSSLVKLGDVDLAELVRQESGLAEMQEDIGEQLQQLNLGDLIAAELHLDDFRGSIDEHLEQMNVGDLLGAELEKFDAGVQEVITQLNVGDALKARLSEGVQSLDELLANELGPLNRIVNQLGAEGQEKLEVVDNAFQQALQDPTVRAGYTNQLRKESEDLARYTLDLSRPGSAAAYEHLLRLDTELADDLAQQADGGVGRVQFHEDIETNTSAGNFSLFGYRLLLSQRVREEREQTLDGVDGSARLLRETRVEKSYSDLINGSKEVAWDAVSLQHSDGSICRCFHFNYELNDKIVGNHEPGQILRWAKDHLGVDVAPELLEHQGRFNMLERLFTGRDDIQLGTSLYFSEKAVDRFAQTDTVTAAKSYFSVAEDLGDIETPLSKLSHDDLQQVLELATAYKERGWFGRTDSTDPHLQSRETMERLYAVITGGDLGDDLDLILRAQDFGQTIDKLDKECAHVDQLLAHIGESEGFCFLPAIGALAQIAGEDETFIDEFSLQGQGLNFQGTHEGTWEAPDLAVNP